MTGTMADRVATRPFVVQAEALVDIFGAADIVVRWIAIASENRDESSANTLHLDRNGIFRASGNYWILRELVKSIAKYADVAPCGGKPVRGNRLLLLFAAFWFVRREAYGAPTPLGFAELRRDRLRLSVRSLLVRRRQRGRPRRSSPKASEVWLGGRDSNPDKQSQSLLSYRWTTSQCGRR